MKSAALTAILCLLPAGCYGFSNFDDDSVGGGSEYDYASAEDVDEAGYAYEELPSACRPSREAWAAAQSLQAETESSVHELVTCGGMQTSLSRNMIAIIVASNRDLFDAAAYADLVQFAATYGVLIENPFTREAEGVWSMPVGNMFGSAFKLTFTDPTTGERIEHDPFVMDTYLTGATATSSLTIDQMQADLFARTTITFQWEAEGPLSHLLNGGEPVPNPFTLSVSMADLGEYALGFDLAPGEPNFGPLASALDTLVSSEVTFVDDQRAARVEYEALGKTAPLKQVAASGVGFDVKSIRATSSALVLSGAASSLNYLARGTLAGVIEYNVEGPGVHLVAESDFGSGSAYPTVRWRCP